MKRTPMRRRAQRDPVTADTRALVLARDGGCVLAQADPGHQCRDAWGTPHDYRDLRRLTLEHVKDSLRMGVRAPSDPSHLVALCAGANIGVPSKAQRAILREWLRTHPS